MILHDYKNHTADLIVLYAAFLSRHHVASRGSFDVSPRTAHSSSALNDKSAVITSGSCALTRYRYARHIPLTHVGEAERKQRTKQFLGNDLLFQQIRAEGFPSLQSLLAVVRETLDAAEGRNRVALWNVLRVWLAIFEELDLFFRAITSRFLFHLGYNEPSEITAIFLRTTASKLFVYILVTIVEALR